MTRSFAMLAFAATLLGPGPAGAQTCNFLITDLNFGSITTSSNANFDISGTFTATCLGSANTTVRMCVNLAGGSGGVDTDGDPRYLLNGTTKLQYMLYEGFISPTQRWGSSLDSISQSNGVFTTLAIGSSGSGSSTLTMSGRVNSGQTSVGAGIYTSSFSGYSQVSYSSGLLTSCAALGTSNSTAVPFTVTAINGNACTVSTTAVDFGSRGVLSSNVDVTGAVKVLCTSGLPYKISLGSGSSGAIATRKMSSGSSALSYNLYSDSTRTTVWGTQTVTGSGTGSTLTHTVYARLPAQTTPKPGSYTDSVIVTVDY